MPSAQYEDLEHGITCIDTEQTRPGLACCYLLRSGDAYAYIETGTPHSVPKLLAVLQDKGIAAEQVKYVIPTHVHLDHAAGAGALLQHLPKAHVVVHPRGAKHLIDPRALIDGATAVYGAEALQKMYGEILPVPEERVIVADDGSKLELNRRELKFYDAPGHARHHFAIWDAQSKGIFSGDAFGLSYREFDGPRGPYLFATTTPVQFEPGAWLQTIDRLLALTPKWLYLTHYGRVGNVAKLAEDLRRGLRRYAEIAESLAEAPQRHLRIKQALMAYELDQLALLECPLMEAKARELLEFDLELNTQGLEVWIDRQRAIARS